MGDWAFKINYLSFHLSMFQGSVNFKIGVLYAKDGQTTDDEFYSNGEIIRYLH